MGTITARHRQDGSTGYTATVRIKRANQIIHSESRTFDGRLEAKAWMKLREVELAKPGALDKKEDPTLSDVVDKYAQDKLRPHGKTKSQVLRSLKASAMGHLRCSEITSQTIIEYLQGMDSQPSTRGNYLSHLAAIFAVAKPAWGYPLEKTALEDARVVAGKLGLIGKSKQRTRRPTLDELNKLMKHFSHSVPHPLSQGRRSIPMKELILFALFSTRRQEEICKLAAEDLHVDQAEIIVRDMKNPDEKLGNDVVTSLTPEALQLIITHGERTGRIWPYDHKSVSSAFTRACKVLGIEDLHFHDLRHEGISRLFEMGWSIPRVATVSGHRSWVSLKRYAHLKQAGDKYAAWPWRPAATTQ
ncbi:tyrosine-type recombinase/integrase [Leptospira sp. 96542]|nr:tyrosine-type recombinase/integrase [Leptospira sp. 96542]